MLNENNKISRSRYTWLSFHPVVHVISYLWLFECHNIPKAVKNTQTTSLFSAIYHYNKIQTFSKNNFKRPLPMFVFPVTGHNNIKISISATIHLERYIEHNIFIILKLTKMIIWNHIYKEILIKNIYFCLTEADLEAYLKCSVESH